MDDYKLQIIETGVILVSYLILRFGLIKAIGRAAHKHAYKADRVNGIRKLANFMLFVIAVFLLFFVWGIDQSKLILFITTMLTVLGVAFFAQWSIISNITATLVVYFNHPAKIGDTVEIYDKEYPIKGTIHEIGLFFIIISSEEGEKTSIPCNVFIQKMVKKVGPAMNG